MPGPASPQEAMQWIREVLLQGSFVRSRHFQTRLRERGIAFYDVCAAIGRVQRVEPYPDFFPRSGGTSWRFFGRNAKGDMTATEEPMKKFKDEAGETFEAADCVSGVYVDPVLPAKFDDTPNESRPASHRKWWDRPFIQTTTWEHMSSGARGPENATEEERARWFDDWRAKWFESWPSGTRYDVRCLDGGAWDRSTSWGMFGTLADAVACATGDGPAWRRGVNDMRKRGQVAGPPPPEKD